MFFVVWFVSGIVLMYAGFPELGEGDRLAQLPQLDLSSARVGLAEAIAGANVKGPPSRITVGMIGNRPVYRIRRQSGGWITVFADSGELLQKVDPATAIEIAAQSDSASPSKMHVVGELFDVDQWTVFPGSRPYLPFYVIAAEGDEGERTYVSAVTGSVYLKTTRRSRTLAWFGAIPHWWYVRALRAHSSLWQGVMIVVSFVGIVFCAAGIVAGILRFSPKSRYRFPGPNYSSIPYAGWKRWHFILGAVFGLFTFTWIFSGFLSMDPGDWSPGSGPGRVEVQSFAGGHLDPNAFLVTPSKAAILFQDCMHPVEIEPIVFQGKPYYLGKDADSEVRLLSAQESGEGCITQIPVPDLMQAGQRTMGIARLLDSTLLSEYDSYYYDRDRQRRLPVLRMRFTDAEKTWLYLDPRTASIAARYTKRSRLERWLYSGLHDLDFPFLYGHRPVWDITVIGLSLGGILLSLTGTLLALKYVRKRYRQRRIPMRADRPGLLHKG
jgi:hypothetical protein